MNVVTTGTIHGNTIVLDTPTPVPDGQTVQVVIRPVAPVPMKWGEGILASAGGWADYPEMESIMEKVHQERKVDRASDSSP